MYLLIICGRFEITAGELAHSPTHVGAATRGVRKMATLCSPLRIFSSRLLSRSRQCLKQNWRREYYVKPKKKGGGSGQAWLALAGVSLTVGGLTLYTLGALKQHTLS